jgi:alcohol dehydrogenase (cytochrome c)
VLALALAAAAARAADWPEPNAGATATRAVPGSPLRATNVGGLRRRWRFRLTEPVTFSGVMSSTPLVISGRVYLQTLHSNVYALDAATGTLLWQRHFERISGGPNGLTSAGGRLYGATDVAAFALDRATGRVLWRRAVTVARRPVNGAPLVAGGLVILGTTAPRPGGKGSVVALSAATGASRWRRSTVAGNWANPRMASGGGVWWTPTADASGGLYVGVGNPLPWGGTTAQPNGGAYRGPALYTDSLLALDLATGRIRWFDQVVPHDVRDQDFTLPPVLASTRARDLVVGAGKGGQVIAWDRRTHRRVWRTPVGLHRNDVGPLPARRVAVCPGLFGGVLTPMAVSRGLVFAAVVDLCMLESSTGSEALASVDLFKRARGQLVALDLATGRPRWRRVLPAAPFSCATVAGDVVFAPTFEGRVRAFAAASGKPLWTVREPAGINACPAVAGRLLVVAAGADPGNLRTPNYVVDAYALP